MDAYLVPAGFGEAEYIEKKSRFIARVWRVGSEEEALAHIAEMRKKHYDARHNVYAYIIRGGAVRFSDDGEPGGTSGMPTLNVFRAGGIFDVCCVVTRYFGGILLGSGGLVRAYSTAAKMALEAAGTAEMGRWERFQAVCAYPLYEKLRREALAAGAVIDDTAFGQDVTLTLLARAGKGEALAARLRELSAGTVDITQLGEEYRAVKTE